MPGREDSEKRPRNRAGPIQRRVEGDCRGVHGAKRYARRGWGCVGGRGASARVMMAMPPTVPSGGAQVVAWQILAAPGDAGPATSSWEKIFRRRLKRRRVASTPSGRGFWTRRGRARTRGLEAEETGSRTRGCGERVRRRRSIGRSNWTDAWGRQQVLCPMPSSALHERADARARRACWSASTPGRSRRSSCRNWRRSATGIWLPREANMASEGHRCCRISVESAPAAASVKRKRLADNARWTVR